MNHRSTGFLSFVLWPGAVRRRLPVEQSERDGSGTDRLRIGVGRDPEASERQSRGENCTDRGEGNHRCEDGAQPPPGEQALATPAPGTRDAEPARVCSSYSSSRAPAHRGLWLDGVRVRPSWNRPGRTCSDRRLRTTRSHRRRPVGKG